MTAAVGRQSEDVAEEEERSPKPYNLTAFILGFGSFYRSPKQIKLAQSEKNEFHSSNI